MPIEKPVMKRSNQSKALRAKTNTPMATLTIAPRIRIDDKIKMLAMTVPFCFVSLPKEFIAF